MTVSNNCAIYIANSAYPSTTNALIDLTFRTPYSIGSTSGTIIVNCNLGGLQRASLTGTSLLSVPTNGINGTRLELWLLASGADRSLNITNLVLIPSDSALSLPKTLTSGKTYVLLLRLNAPTGAATNWWLTSLVGGF